MKFYFANSGCLAEQLDFNRLVSLANGEITENLLEADVIITHFCAISTDAFKTIPDYMAVFSGIKKYFPNVKIYVGGCAEGVLDLKKRYPFIDGVFKRRSMVEDLSMYFNIKPDDNMAVCHYNLVRIQSGCLRNCGFCKKAFLKMPLVSRPIDLVKRDVEKAVKEGHPDILLFAENATEYGLDIETHLIDLLKEVVTIEGISSIYLTGLCIDELVMHNDLLQFIKNSPLITQIQAEIQSLIPEVRKLMRLTSTKEDVISVLKELSGKTIITNVMLGYPGENDDNFEEQLKVIRENNMYYIQCNTYDNTPGVFAYSFEQVSKEKIQKRVFRLVQVLNELRQSKAMELKKEPYVTAIYTSEGRWLVLGESAYVDFGKVSANPGDTKRVKIDNVKTLIDMNDPNQAFILKGRLVR